MPAFVASMPLPLVCWTVPPLIVSAPVVPVPESTIPLVGPETAVPAETDANVSPDAPIVSPDTLSAVPVVVARVLVVALDDTVPPPLALSAVFEVVVAAILALKLIVAP